MNLVPVRPPGPNARKARAFAADIARLRAQGYTFEAIREALAGAGVGAVLGLAGVAVLPSADQAGGFLTGLGFQGAGWLLPLVLPPMAGLVAFAATRAAAFRKLKELN